jgi:hypothetical protein
VKVEKKAFSLEYCVYFLVGSAASFIFKICPYWVIFDPILPGLAATAVTLGFG